MILGNEAIQAAMEAGHIVCNPTPQRIETHIDITLGNNFWIPRDTGRAIDIGSDDPAPHYLLLADATVCELPPGCAVLAHSQEAVGTTVPWLEPHIETRSTLARWFTTIHVSAGIGDPGYCSKWTLEIVNNGPFHLLLTPGQRVGLIKFYRVESNSGLYTGRYNTPDAEWTPDAMLPRRGNI
jgi:dCTP deaminase